MYFSRGHETLGEAQHSHLSHNLGILVSTNCIMLGKYYEMLLFFKSWHSFVSWSDHIENDMQRLVNQEKYRIRTKNSHHMCGPLNQHVKDLVRQFKNRMIIPLPFQEGSRLSKSQNLQKSFQIYFEGDKENSMTWFSAQQDPVSHCWEKPKGTQGYNQCGQTQTK